MESNNKYKVLARKYRPQNFTDLVGQENMVKVVKNSFESGRIHHAYIFTGIRGVGKTTTARIIAKALNCKGVDGLNNKPTLDICGVCSSCVSIMEDRHPDCLEMDAASKTSIEDVKEIIDFARYLPVSARYKVIIVDEVHMLSNKAFNALLKTLEEPPAHVIFIFATTELKKIPVTIVSRCQKFELRRLSEDELTKHLKNICNKEKISFEEEALQIIAISSEGSVRDSLSLLDQAINHSLEEDNGEVKAEEIIKILGRASNDNLLQLFRHILSGDAQNTISLVNEMLLSGAMPMALNEMLLELTHSVSLLKQNIKPNGGLYLSKSNIESLNSIITDTSIAVLTRLWSMLLKGLEEMKICHDPKLALEMLLMRLCFVKAFPTPIDLLSGNGGGSIQQTSPSTKSIVSVAQEVYTKSPSSFDEVIHLCEKKGKLIVASQLKRDVRLVKFSSNSIELNLFDAPKTLITNLKQDLEEWTGESWTVISSEETGEATVKEKIHIETNKKILDASSNSNIKQILDTFPKSKVVSVDDILVS
ncbi:MAG: DNA polymerase III subunit gamma/tau [Alphaproteobacteria bacterium]|nr:DNA polymerase III subunit gamma/tau [Alphaproteobacteria bacterium]OJV12187.1 MAG: hypothetical protein BGO27_05555 [Alphaproteobacteria bacterium 33-17]